MAVNINATTTSGLQISSDNSGAIVFQNNGTNSLVLPTTGTITLPNATGTAVITTTGTVAGTLIRAPQIKTSGTSYTTPSNCTAIYVELVGGGGGGGGSNTNSNATGTGGAAGAYTFKYFTVLPSTAYTYAIGTNGTGGNSANGTAGGNTTFTVGATTVTATGGTAGTVQSTATAASVSGVTSTNGDLNVTSQPGYCSAILGAILSVGGSVPNFGSGGILTQGSASGAVNGTAGSGYGSGGSGGTCRNSGGVTSTGGNGTAGIIRIWEYA